MCQPSLNTNVSEGGEKCFHEVLQSFFLLGVSKFGLRESVRYEQICFWRQCEAWG